MTQVLKYLLEGVAVAVAAYYITGKKTDLKEVSLLGLTAAVVFYLIDAFAPEVSGGLRQGSGFGIGYGLVGGGPTPMPWEYYNPGTQKLSRKPLKGGQYGGNPLVGGEGCGSCNKVADAVVEEGFESEEQARQVAADLNKPYKLKDGQYAAKVLMPGYNENVRPYNARGSKYVSKPSPWTHQEGGLDLGSRMAQEGGDGSAEATIAPVATPAEGTPAPPAVDTEGKKNEKIMNEGNAALREKNYRKPGVVYSGDLIHINVGENVMKRDMINNQIVVGKPLPKTVTNLSKLRLVHPKHKKHSQKALKYGDQLYLKHNAYVENVNTPYFVKFGDGGLFSHYSGPSFRLYKVFDAADAKRTGEIEASTEVIFCRGDTAGEKIYFKVEKDGKVNSKATAAEATKFKINPHRVYELHNENLRVGAGEILYP